jgi:hypothetical protein
VYDPDNCQALYCTVTPEVYPQQTEEEIGRTISELDPMPWGPENKVAEAWASMDGRAGVFHLCRVDPISEIIAGRYAGYMADAKSLIERIESRGAVVADVWAVRIIMLIALLIGVGLGYSL